MSLTKGIFTRMQGKDFRGVAYESTETGVDEIYVRPFLMHQFDNDEETTSRLVLVENWFEEREARVSH